MRNPERIPTILAKLNQAWLAAPDMRFGQLVHCIMPKREDNDHFNIEDDAFEAALNKWLESVPKKVVSLRKDTES